LLSFEAFLTIDDKFSTFKLPTKKSLKIFFISVILILLINKVFGSDLVLSPDSVIPQKKAPVLTEKVEYNAQDSMRFDIQSQKVFLYGDATVNYGTVELKAAYIVFDLKNNELYAKGVLDTNDNYIGRPYFEDAGQGFVSDSIKYNFKSQKGKIHKAVAQEGEGFIHGAQIKKVSDDVMYIKDGKYTTCNLDHDPHFAIESKKLKLIKDDKIITGAAWLTVADVPTPLVLPFGYFPTKKGRSSGIILPTYGDSPRLGFFLNNGGYYWGINDQLTAAFTGDIYTRGSYALRSTLDYKTRYKRNGRLTLQYSNFKQGLNGDVYGTKVQAPDYSESKNVFVVWRHQQDPKKNPKSNFSADVNAGSVSNFRNNINSTSNDFLTNTFKSNILYNRSFNVLGKASNLTLNASHDQNTRDSVINLTLPSANFAINRFYPFKKMVKTGSNLGRIGISYNTSFLNRMTTKEDSNFFRSEKLQEILQSSRNGFRQNIPISASQKIFKYVTLSENFNYTGYGYLKTFQENWDTNSTNNLNIDTISGFDYFDSWNMSANLSTRYYMMYTYGSNSKIQAIRHTLTPTAGFSYLPESNKDYFSEYYRYDAEGNLQDTIEYSRFTRGIYGGPRAGDKQGNINFSLQNNIEMKVATPKDSVNTSKKIKLLENLSLSSSYNVFADSLNLAPVSINAWTTLFKNFTVRFTSRLDPYALDLESGTRVNTFEYKKWELNSRLARMTDATVNVGFSLKGGKKRDNKKKESELGSEEELEYINAHPEEFIDYSVPWSLNMSYNFIYRKPLYEPTFTNSLTFNGDVKLTENWRVGFRSGYDITNKEFTLTTLDIYRDLHCWEMKLHVIPFGTRQSFRLDINVKASVLQDLKLTRRREWYDRGF
jgi:lipopolysaccharide assembly outer membrane protein LptD (OstA)